MPKISSRRLLASAHCPMLAVAGFLETRGMALAGFATAAPALRLNCLVGRDLFLLGFGDVGLTAGFLSLFVRHVSWRGLVSMFVEQYMDGFCSVLGITVLR